MEPRRAEEPTTLDEAVREAAEALDQLEVAGWRLAELTARWTRSREGPQEPGQVTMSEWALLVTEQTHRSLAESTARDLKSAWVR